jgi:N-methylhydantoinase A/oxoprolinase/acetone carboxylase beta subunit
MILAINVEGTHTDAVLMKDFQVIRKSKVLMESQKPDSVSQEGDP